MSNAGARREIAVEHKALAAESKSPGVQVEVDKARQESEELRAKMDAAEAEFQRMGNDPVSEAIAAGGVPPIIIPPQTQLSVGSDFPRVESMDPQRNEQMPPLEETRESDEEESEGDDSDYDDDNEFDNESEDEDYEDDSEVGAEPYNAEYHVNEEPMTDTVAAGILVGSMEGNLLMGMDSNDKGGNNAGIGGASQQMEGTTQEETPTNVDTEIMPAPEPNLGSRGSADISREPSAAISASGDARTQPQAATPSSQQDLENRDLDLSESSSSNTGAPAAVRGGDFQHPNGVPVQAGDDTTTNMPDLEVSAASGDMVSGSINHGSSLFSEDADDDDEEFPPRSPVSSDGDDLFSADDESDDDDVF